jgi:hypothetical protein
MDIFTIKPFATSAGSVYLSLIKNEAVLEFRHVLATSPELQARLKDGTSFIKLAHEHGHAFAENELTTALEDLKADGAELTDFELEAVSGGGFWLPVALA